MQLRSDGGRAGGLSKAFLRTGLMGDMVSAGVAAVGATPYTGSLSAAWASSQNGSYTPRVNVQRLRERVSGRRYITSYDLALEFTELLPRRIHKVQPRLRARRQTPPLVAGVTKF